MTTIDSNNCIPTGLRADVMRRSMENKNLLSTKGSIYVGTGEVLATGEVKTEAKSVGTQEVIIAEGSDISSGKILSEDSFDSSVVYSNLKNTFDLYTFQNSNFDSTAEYANIKLLNSNFSGAEKYSNLNFFPNGDHSISYNVSGVGTFQLERDRSTGVMGVSFLAGQYRSSYLVTVCITLLNFNLSKTRICRAFYSTSYPGNVSTISQLFSILKNSGAFPVNSAGDKVWFFPSGGTPLNYKQTGYNDADVLADFCRMTKTNYTITSSQISVVEPIGYERGPWGDDDVTITVTSTKLT